MKKTLLILSLIAFGLTSVSAQTVNNGKGKTASDNPKENKVKPVKANSDTSSTDTAAMVFEKKTHDFGTIEEGTRAKTVFKFTNTGNVPLVLTNVKPSCGCTSPNWSREPIAPGETGEITVEFNSNGKGGSTFHKSVTVTSNAGVTVIYIKGNVVKKPTEPESPVRIKN